MKIKKQLLVTSTILIEVSDKLYKKLESLNTNKIQFIINNSFKNNSRKLLDYSITYNYDDEFRPKEISVKNFALLIDFINNDQKLKAIKYLNDCTGWGLKNSKDFVNELSQKL